MKSYTYVKLFRNKDLLAEMLALRSQNASVSELARTFHCHRTAIIYWLGDGKQGKARVIKEQSKIRVIHKYENVFAEVNPHKGMRYKDYLKIQSDKLTQEDEQLIAFL